LFNAVGFSASSTNAGSSGTFNRFEGYGGADTVHGNGNTSVAYFNATAGVSITMTGAGAGSATATYSSNTATDTFDGVNLISGSGNADTFNGGPGNDNFEGGTGNDTINGGDGDDRLVGQGGNDVITGGNGNDTFVFDNTALNASTNVDTITDFTTGQDKIELNHNVFTALPTGSLSGSAFSNAGSVTASTRIIYDLSDGSLSYDADGSGSGAATKFAVLVGIPAISSTDFNVS
jgi:Ca2+-binding RTX toxin-like protein